jgi:hypothetical protein
MMQLSPISCIVFEKQVREVTLFWGQNSIKARHLALAFLIGTAATAASADILVVRSTGPSAKMYPPGKSLREAAKLSLKQGDMLVVLDGRGTRMIRGPGNFAAGAAQSASQPMQTAAATPARRARIGAVRGATSSNAPPRPATLWQVDVTKSSNICLADPSNVTLWRADATKPVTLTIMRDGGTSQKVSWPAGQSTLAWPSDVAISDNAQYSLSWDGAAAPTRLKFRTLPTKPSGLEDMASSLIRNKCDAQLDLLIETVKLPDQTPPAG